MKHWLQISLIGCFGGVFAATAVTLYAEDEVNAAAREPAVRETEFIPENGEPVPPSRFRGRRRPDRRLLGETDMELVERMLDLPPERLHHMRRTIESIERMSPEEKARLRNKISDFKHLPANKRSLMLESWNRVPANDRYLLRLHWQDLSREEREEERSKVRRMKPDERGDYFEQLFDRLRSKSPNRDAPDAADAEEAISVEKSGDK